MRSEYLNNVVLAVIEFKKYMKENEKTIDETSKAVITQALKAARSIISSNKSSFNKEELRVLLNDND